MTYQIEGNFTGNLMYPFLAPLEVTQGQQVLKLSKVQ